MAIGDKLLKLLSRGSQKAPAIIDDVVEEAGPLATRVTSEATEVAPEVIGKATRVAPVADDAIEAVYKEITPTTGMDDMARRMDPRLAKFIGAAGLLGGGAMMMGGDEEPQIPMAKSVTPEEKIQAELPVVETKTSQQKISQATTAPKNEIAPVSNQEPEKLDYLEQLKMAQADQKKNDIAALIAQGGSDIANGFKSGVGLRDKADYSLADYYTTQGAKGVSNVKERLSMETANKELNDEQKMRDSSSDISRTAREIAKGLGINVSDKTSAKELQKAGLPLGTLLSTKIAADARKEAAQLAREQKITAKAQDLDEKQRKFAQGLRKEATTGVLGKQYATYSTGQRMASALDEFAKNPSGYKDYATLMGGLKTLQGDESVVREAEVRMGMSATSLIDGLMNQLQKAQNGQMLQPKQRQEMIDTIKTLTDLSRQQYMQSVAPILEQAEMEGISSDIILTGSLSGARGGSAGLSTAQQAQYSAKEEAGIQAFMDAKGISRDEAVKKLKAGGRLK